jgi:hypothetical protein
MGTSKTQPAEWMLNDGTGKSTIFGDERGWVRKMADGQEVVLHCMKDVNYTPPTTSPHIVSVTNPAAGDYSISANEIIRFSVYFDEDITVTGNPVVTFDEAGSPQQATYNSGTSLSDMLSFEYAVANIGAINDVQLSINLNGGTIVAVSDGSPADVNFPVSYDQPTGVNVIA